MAKAKISVTVDSELLRRCDRAAQGASRSEIFERALARWLRETKRRLLEDEIERYYAAQEPAERSEDADWAELAPQVISETWK